MRYALALQFERMTVEAWVPDLLGCFCVASNEREAIAQAPPAIAEYLAWLHRHREEAVSIPEVIEVDVEERVVATAETSWEICFAADEGEVRDEELEVAIQRMGYARSDLLRIVASLPAVALDWRPAPAKRTVREIVQHIASADGYYRASLQESADQTSEERLDIETQRALTIARLRAMTPLQRGTFYRPAWREPSEPWTTRKVLRRIIYHERFHIRDIEQTLAWLIIGYGLSAD